MSVINSIAKGIYIRYYKNADYVSVNFLMY